MSKSFDKVAAIESVKRGALTVEIPLRFPVEHLTRPLAALTMRRPKVGDILDSKKNRSAEEAEVNLLARVTDTSPDVIRSLDWADYDVVTDILVAFRS